MSEADTTATALDEKLEQAQEGAEEALASFYRTFLQSQVHDTAQKIADRHAPFIVGHDSPSVVVVMPEPGRI